MSMGFQFFKPRDSHPDGFTIGTVPVMCIAWRKGSTASSTKMTLHVTDSASGTSLRSFQYRSKTNAWCPAIVDLRCAIAVECG